MNEHTIRIVCPHNLSAPGQVIEVTDSEPRILVDCELYRIWLHSGTCRSDGCVNLGVHALHDCPFARQGNISTGNFKREAPFVSRPLSLNPDKEY